MLYPDDEGCAYVGSIDKAGTDPQTGQTKPARATETEHNKKDRER